MTHPVRFPNAVWELILDFVPVDRYARSPTSDAFREGVRLHRHGCSSTSASITLRRQCGMCRRRTLRHAYFFVPDLFTCYAHLCRECWRVYVDLSLRVERAIREGRLQ